MQEKEIVRKQNYINRIEVFKERTDEFFANYENLSGGDECLEVCLIRDGCRAVSQAEKTINRLQAENERLEKENKLLIKNDVLNKYPNCVLVEKGRIYTRTLEDYDELIGDISAEAYKKFAERLKENFEPLNSPLLNNRIDNLLKELEEK